MISFKQYFAEAAIMPHDETLDAIVNVFNKSRQEYAKGIKAGDLYIDAKKQLEPYNVQFQKMDVNTIAQCNGGGIIVINDQTFINYLIGDIEEDKLREVIGHEIVHRHQFARRNLKLNQDYNKKQSYYTKQIARKKNETHADYRNSSDEVMAYAYELAKRIYTSGSAAKVPNKQTLLNIAFKNLQNNAFMTDQIKQYTNDLTPENKKRFYKYVYDYIGQMFDRQQG